MMEETHEDQQKDASMTTSTQPSLSTLVEEWRAKAKEEEREGAAGVPLLADADADEDEDNDAAKKPTPEERRRAFADTTQRGFQGSLASLLSSLSSSSSASSSSDAAKSRRRRRPCLRRWRFSFSRWPLRFLRIQEKVSTTSTTTHQEAAAAAARAERAAQQNRSNSEDEMDDDEDEMDDDEEEEGAGEESLLRQQQVREDVEREEKRERAVMLANLLVALILVSSLLLVLRVSLDGWQHISSWSSLVSIFAHSSLLWLARWRHDHGRLSAWFACLFANVILLYRCLVFGVRSEMFAWISMLPIVLFCLLGTRAGVLATIGLLGESLLIYSLTPDDAHNGHAYDLDCVQINQQQGTVFVPFACAPLDRHGSHVGHFITSIEGLLASKILLIAFMGVFAYVYESNRHSALKRMKVALQQKERVNLSLQQATKAKTAFLANMSHELRTPMHGIIAMAKDLLEMQLSKDAFESARVISDCADHLLGLVNDILDFARIESHQLVLESIPLSVHEEVDKAVNLHAAMAKKKNVELVTNVDIAQLHRIGDPLRFRQILINLLSNAVKFTPSGGRVTVSALSEGDNDPEMVSVQVKDTGIGIPPQGLENIFKSFSQLDASVGRKFGGSGLGLAISKKLCQAMHGDIKVESEVDKGSVFTFSVRLPHPPPGTSLNPSPAHLAAEKDNTALLKELMHEKKVLVVEDNMINQKVATKMLTSLGCSVTIAGDGSAAVTLFEQESFDVILMDVQMPIMDGFQATARIRQIEQQRSKSVIAGGSDDDDERGDDKSKSKEMGPSGEDDLYNNDEGDLSEDRMAAKQSVTRIRPIHEPKRVPIVALTASATTDYEAECLEKGMDRFLTKPFKKEMLQATLLGIFHPLALSSTSASVSGSLSSASSPAPSSPPSSPLP
jgi:signal transduction histidine kinase/DNA-binding response OmpR family regulator